MSTVLLGDVCRIVGGGTPSKARKAFYEGTIPWATVRDMHKDLLEDTQFHITQEAIEKSSTNIIPKGSVIIASRVGLGKACVLLQDTAINQDLRAIIPTSKTILNTQYLFLWLKSIEQRIISAGTGATVQGVKLPFIKSLQLPLPDIAEQKRIVKKLDEAFAAIDKAKENTEKNLRNVRELFRSELFSLINGSEGKEVKLGEFITLHYGKALDKNNRDPNAKYDVYGANGIKNKSDRYLWDKPSIIVGRKGSAGEINLTSGPFWPLDVTYYIEHNSKETNLTFIFLLLKTLDLPSLARGVKPGINRNDVYAIKINLPNLSEQQRIVKKLDKLAEKTEKLQKLYQQKLDNLEELKQSILKRAFEG